MADQTLCCCCAPERRVRATLLITVRRITSDTPRAQASTVTDEWAVCDVHGADGVEVVRGGFLQQRDIAF